MKNWFKNLVKRLYRKYFPIDVTEGYLNGIKREFVDLNKLSERESKDLYAECRNIVDGKAFELIINDILREQLEVISVSSKELHQEMDARLLMRFVFFVEDKFKNYASLAETEVEIVEDPFKIT
jgi:hypothetical protein